MRVLLLISSFITLVLASSVNAQTITATQGNDGDTIVFSASEAKGPDAAKSALGGLRDELENDPNAPAFGNPDGDITVVEFFDYNSGNCKRPSCLSRVANPGRGFNLCRPRRRG